MKHKIGVDYLRSEHTNLTLSNTKWGTDLGMLVVPFDQSFHQLHTSQFISVLTTSPQCTFILQPRDLLVNKRDLLAKCLSGTYCHKTGTRPPSCQLLENRLYMLDCEHVFQIYLLVFKIIVRFIILKRHPRGIKKVSFSPLDFRNHFGSKGLWKINALKVQIFPDPQIINKCAFLNLWKIPVFVAILCSYEM